MNTTSGKIWFIILAVLLPLGVSILHLILLLNVGNKALLFPTIIFGGVALVSLVAFICHIINEHDAEIDRRVEAMRMDRDNRRRREPLFDEIERHEIIKRKKTNKVEIIEED